MSTPTSDIELVLGGMTCASCANRIERKLNKLEGVTASVNYATEKARVRYAPEVSPDQLLAAVEAAGYSALVRSWLTTFGPGTAADIQWWLGSTKTAVTRALADVDAVQVTLDDAATADELFSTLMGEDVEARRSFIQRNARDVRFLDI